MGYCGSFKSVISDTVLKNIAPELLESSDTVYAQSDLNIEEIMKLNLMLSCTMLATPLMPKS